MTHSVHMNSRLVQLEVDTGGSGDGETDIIHIAGPPTPDDYPPGPAWLYVLDDGIPSEGIKVMVGNPDSNGQSSHR